MPEPHDPAAKDYTDREVRHLRELLEQKISSGDAAAVALVTSADKALQIQMDEQRAWRAGANEWRAALSDAALRNMPRSEIDSKFLNVEKDVDTLKAFMNTQQGSKASLVAALAALLGVIGTALAIFNTIRLSKP